MKVSDEPDDRSADRCRLTIGLNVRSGLSNDIWSVVATIPGRESVSIRRWKAVRGTLTRSQLNDMAHYVAQQVSVSAELLTGEPGEVRLTI